MPKSQGGSHYAGSHVRAVLQSRTVATLVLGVGYIGSRLVQELLFQGRDVVAVDNFFSTDRRAIEAFRYAAGFTLVEGSIVDDAVIDTAIAAAGDVDSIYLLAAQSSAHPDAASPAYTEEVNLGGPRRLLDAVVQRRVEVPIVFASSMRVYGSPLPPVVEESTPYGAFADLSHLSKCYVEKLLEMYSETRGLCCRSVRLGLVYGVAPVMKTDRRFMTAPNLFSYQAANGQTIEIRNGDALPLIHADDAMRSLVWTAERIQNRGYTIVNAVSEMASLVTVAEELRRAAASKEQDVNVRIGEGVRKVSETVSVVRSALDSLGFRGQRRLAEGIAETYDHFLVHGQ